VQKDRYCEEERSLSLIYRLLEKNASSESSARFLSRDRIAFGLVFIGMRGDAAF